MLGALAALAAGLASWWRAAPEPVAAAAGPAPSAFASLKPESVASAAPAAVALAPRRAAPPAPPAPGDRAAQHALARERLERARQALEAYQQAARYPHESRPIAEHPDQVHPFEPVSEERALRVPGGSVTQGVRLRTSQERTFLAGGESSRVTLSLVDNAGNPLPLRVTRAVLKEVTQPGRTSSTAEQAMALNDAGQAGDARAGDGVFTALVQPATQGFATYSGLVRLELNLEYGGQPGFLYFDFIHSPEQAARWLPGVREAVIKGSLEFFLKAEVMLPGRYVVSARVDDANGRTVALALFNQELAQGAQEIRLPVFGRLILDSQPVFPLRLRDVDAFLLKPDTYPDRVMLPRLPGVVHTSRLYAYKEFSPALWSSEERDRYLAELNKDVDQATREVSATGP